MSLRNVVFKSGMNLLSVRKGDTDRPLPEIRNFVLMQHQAALGSVLHATPLVPALRAAVPGAKIIVACSGFAAQVYRRNPRVDMVLPVPSPLESPFAAARMMRNALKLFRPFATITTLGNERSSIAFTTWLANAGNRVGFTLAPELYRVPLAFDPAESQIANNLRIVEALGHPKPERFEPEIYFSDESLQQAVAMLGPSLHLERTLAVLISQTSTTQRKGWRLERFVAAAQHLVDHHDADIVFVGTAAERNGVEEIRRRVKGATWNLAGRTNLRQLAALLSICDVGLSLDTGTMHIGRAVGLPMVIIAPAWSPEVEWLPVGNPRYRILKNGTLAHMPSDYVIDEVSVEEVNAGLDELLAAWPRERRHRMANSSR